MKDALDLLKNVPLEVLRDELDRDACENSLAYFIRKSWPYIDPSPYIHGWHVDAVAEHLEAVARGNIRHLIINQPPRTQKSITSAVALCPWVWSQTKKAPLLGPQVSFMYASYAHHLSLRDSVKSRRLIESPMYQKHWGARFSLTSDQNTKIKFDNDKGGYRLSTSVGGSLTGEGADIIVCLPYDQKILTDVGHIKIGSIVNDKLNVKVAGYDGKSIIWQEIEAYEKNPFKKLLIITTSGGMIECTEDHPIFVVGKGYVDAKSVKVDDCILRVVHKKNQQMAKRLKEACASFLLPILPWKMGWKWKKKPQLSWRGNRGKVLEMRTCVLRASFAEKFRKILFQRMQGLEREKKNIIGQKVCGLRKFIQTTAEHIKVLFREMPSYTAFHKYTWIPFTELRAWASHESISKRMDVRIQENDKRKRWACLPDMWSWRIFTYSPRGFSQRKYRSMEPDNIVQMVSWETARTLGTREEKVVSVKDNERKEDNVYNIRTSLTHNYFANGVLVHNCDDPHNATEIESEAVREGVIMFWDEALSTRLNNPKTGCYIIVMQRLSEADLTGHILARNHPDFTHLMLPMRFESDRKCFTWLGDIKWEDPRAADGELLWPERFGENEVNALERALGPYGVSSQLQQSPSPRGGGIFKRDWWQVWPPEGYADTAKVQFPAMEFIVASVDTAYTEKKENDYSACTVWGVWRDKGNLPRLMLMRAWEERLEFHDLVQKIIATCKPKTGPVVDALIVEAKASGISIAQEIRRLCAPEDFSVHEFNPGSGDKVARAYAVQHLFSSGCVYAPERKYADMVIDCCEKFPKDPRHRDIVDSVTQAMAWLRKRGLAVLAEEGSQRNAEAAAYRPQTDSVAEQYGI